jgi:hypothetical protein
MAGPIRCIWERGATEPREKFGHAVQRLASVCHLITSMCPAFLSLSAQSLLVLFVLPILLCVCVWVFAVRIATLYCSLTVNHAQCVAGASHRLSNELSCDYWGTLLTTHSFCSFLVVQFMDAINAMYEATAASTPGVTFLDCGDLFITDGGRQVNQSLFMDVIHPNPAGACRNEDMTQSAQRSFFFFWGGGGIDRS